MDLLILAFVTLVIGVVVGWYDTYSVQRTYADIYAERHGHVPPLADWFFHRDADPDVEYWRRRHRNLYLLVTALGVVVIGLVVARQLT